MQMWYFLNIINQKKNTFYTEFDCKHDNSIIITTSVTLKTH